MQVKACAMQYIYIYNKGTPYTYFMNLLSRSRDPFQIYTHTDKRLRDYITLHCDAVARGCCFALTLANDSDAFVIVKILARSGKEKKRLGNVEKFTDYNECYGYDRQRGTLCEIL